MRARSVAAVCAALALAGVQSRSDSGIAVHIGARVTALAGPGEVLVSRTVKDLVAGSGLVFEDRGSHTLKGLPDAWQLFAASSKELATSDRRP